MPTASTAVGCSNELFHSHEASRIRAGALATSPSTDTSTNRVRGLWMSDAPPDLIGDRAHRRLECKTIADTAQRVFGQTTPGASRMLPGILARSAPLSTRAFSAIVFFTAVSAAACSRDTTAPPNGRDLAVVLSVIPVSGATSVDPTSPITIAFSHPMMIGMETLVVLHEGTITGPAVAGTATWSTDRTRLMFAPSQPLKSTTTYVLHLSPNLTDADGQKIDFAACATRVGGQVVSGSMMTGGMMGGTGTGMMGPGWQAGTGTWGYGMSFAFTTA